MEQYAERAFDGRRYKRERALKRSERRRGGRAPMDAVMMFKVLVLQALWGLSEMPPLVHVSLRSRREGLKGARKPCC